MRILEIVVQPDIESIKAYYDKLRIYRAATFDGSYSLITTINLADEKSLYTYIDNSGLSTDVYRFAYFKTVGSVESSRYDLPGFYFTIAALKARVNEITDTDDHSFIDTAAAATDAVNRYCGRRFNQVIETRYFQGSPSKHFYIGAGAQILCVDDFVSLSAISVTYPSGATGINPVSGVYFLPENASRKDWPYEELAIVPGGTDYWPTGYHKVAITATWGWPVNPITQSTVPAAVKEAAMEIALRLYQGKTNGYSNTIGQADLGTKEVEDGLMSKNVKSLLEMYRKGC